MGTTAVRTHDDPSFVPSTTLLNHSPPAYPPQVLHPLVQTPARHVGNTPHETSDREDRCVVKGAKGEVHGVKTCLTHPIPYQDSTPPLVHAH